jgi:hypothetical protein
MVAVQGEEGFVDINGNGDYDLGEPFIDSGEPFVDDNDNGIRDGDERFIDQNQNGIWDPPNGVWDKDTVVWAETRVLYTGASLNGRWVTQPDVATFPNPTAPVTFDLSVGPPPSTDRLAVIFSDENFNPTTPAGTYQVSSVHNAVAVKFVTPPPTLDNLGMTFVQQYCDQKPPTAPTSCAATCQTAPCYRVARVTSFQYGAVGIVDITAAVLGMDEVKGSVDINGVISEHLVGGVVH